MNSRLRSIVFAAFAAAFVFPFASKTAAGQAVPDHYETLRWRHIGPEGNRFSAAAGIAGNPHVYYVGAASGGIYKTTDGGVHWDAIFDDQPVQSIGALDVADSDPNVRRGRGRTQSASTPSFCRS